MPDRKVKKSTKTSIGKTSIESKVSKKAPVPKSSASNSSKSGKARVKNSGPKKAAPKPSRLTASSVKKAAAKKAVTKQNKPAKSQKVVLESATGSAHPAESVDAYVASGKRAEQMLGIWRSSAESVTLSGTTTSKLNKVSAYSAKPGSGEINLQTDESVKLKRVEKIKEKASKSEHQKMVEAYLEGIHKQSSKPKLTTTNKLTVGKDDNSDKIPAEVPGQADRKRGLNMSKKSDYMEIDETEIAEKYKQSKLARAKREGAEPVPQESKVNSETEAKAAKATAAEDKKAKVAEAKVAEAKVAEAKVAEAKAAKAKAAKAKAAKAKAAKAKAAKSMEDKKAEADAISAEELKEDGNDDSYFDKARDDVDMTRPDDVLSRQYADIAEDVAVQEQREAIARSSVVIDQIKVENIGVGVIRMVGNGVKNTISCGKYTVVGVQYCVKDTLSLGKRAINLIRPGLKKG